MRPGLVSVVTIFLDEERFLAEAIESVLTQTYSDWELLLVDDGSRDASTALAREHAARRPERIRYLDHEGHANLGMSASRNLGLQHARGEYVAFLDADDVYRPEKLERQLALLQAHPSAAMVYGATEHWHSWAGDGKRDRRRTLGVPPDTLIAPPRLVPLFLTLRAQTPGTCGLLVRRSEAIAIGGFERRFRGMFEDQVFIYKICLGSRVYVEGGSWDRYRQHPRSHANATRAAGDDQKRGPSPTYLGFLEWLEGYVEAHGVDDSEMRRALGAQLATQRRPRLERSGRRAPRRRFGRLVTVARAVASRLARSRRAGAARR